ncbi:hypothetical protein AMJ85_05860 [candidate division BRC1 bacterium SM23_51]|nr:MAG: hypothetical protein AMJ85_05860 [candidate division BRC1 bacterium SM23_51]
MREESKAEAIGLWKRILFSLVAFCLGAVALLGAGEIVCRLLHGDKFSDLSLNYFPPGSVIYDPVVGWRYRPGYEGQWRYFEYAFNVKINSTGLRDREYGPKSKPRILFIGDSHTFGVGVDISQTFVKRVEKVLNADGAPVECINGGRVAAGSDLYLHYTRKYVPELVPNVVAVCFFPENDFDDTWYFNSNAYPDFHNVHGEVYVGDEPLARERKHRAGVLFRNSAFYRFLRLRFCRLSVNLGENPFHGTWLDVYLREEPAWVKEATSKTIENLGAIQHICQSRNARLTLILLPSNFDSAPKCWRHAVGKSPRGAEAYDREKPFRVLTQFAQERNVALLDVRDAVQCQRGLLYFKHDRHLNSRGHKVVAGAFVSFLEKERLLPRQTQEADSAKPHD